jgi:hypothetical protein
MGKVRLKKRVRVARTRSSIALDATYMRHTCVLYFFFLHVPKTHCKNEMANLLVHRSQLPLALLLQGEVSSSTTTLLVHGSEVLLALLLQGNILLLNKR